MTVFKHFMLQVPLNASPEQQARAHAVPAAFAQAFNSLTPTVQKTRGWNRVAPHHSLYRTFRKQFARMESQIVGNAIRAVSHTSRHLLQHLDRPFNLTRLAGEPLPPTLVRFGNDTPVHFGRPTESQRDGQRHIYTPYGRIKFTLALTHADEANFNEKKLRELILACRPDGVFGLSFPFSESADDDVPLPTANAHAEVPEYVLVEEAV